MRRTATRSKFRVLGSLILAHDANAVIKGLKDWPPQDRPPVAIPFFAFRIMVGIGVIMLGLVVASWWLRFKGRLFETRWFLRACQWWPRWASSPCWPGGSPPKWDASPGPFTACSALRIRSLRP